MAVNKKIVLDAGHGFNTPGKRTPAGSAGVVREWTLNNFVCNYIAEFLADYNAEIFRVDDITGVTDVPVQARTNIINQINPDLFVSIHHNAAGTGSEWSSATGIEVFSHPDKPKRDADLAKIFADEMSRVIGLRNRGAKQANFHMVRNTNSSIPSVLCEGGFMDSIHDYPVITSDKGQGAYARAISDICVSYLDLTQKNPENPDTGTGEITEGQYEELKKLIYDLTENSRIKYGYVDQNMPEWARWDITELMDDKILLGDERGNLRLSHDMLRMLVIINRVRKGSQS